MSHLTRLPGQSDNSQKQRLPRPNVCVADSITCNIIIRKQSQKMGNQFKNVAMIACLKTLLFVFNIVFWISGLALLVAGLWAELELHEYVEISAEFSGTAPHVLLGIAALVVLVSSVAFSCIVKGQPVLLYIYGGFLACIFMMDAGVGASVACYKDTFAKGLHDGLTQSLANYKYPDNANFDFTQSTLHCCGVNNYTDWITRQKPIPLSCCIESNQCVPANYNQIYNRGCYNVIVEHLNSNMNLMIGIAIGMAIFPLFGTILSCCLANYIKKSKYDTIN